MTQGSRGAGRKTRTTGTFGSVDELPSGRYRARYYGPDGRRYQAPTLFTAKVDARAWLSLRQSEIIRHAWVPPGTEKPKVARLTLADYAKTWMAQRDLKDRTREHYQKLLDQHIVPGLGALPLASITADDVRRWYAGFGTGTPTLRAHCYGLLRTILATAASDGRIQVNPCVIRGAGSARRVHKIRPASLTELEKLTAAMPEQYRAMILLASWCALRFGELTELRRRDIDLTDGTIRVQRAVVRVGESSRSPRRSLRPASATSPSRRTCCRHLKRTCRNTLHLVGTRCCSLPSTVATWPPPRCTGSSTEPVTPLGGQTYASTTFGIPALSWPQRRVRHSRN